MQTKTFFLVLLIAGIVAACSTSTQPKTDAMDFISSAITDEVISELTEKHGEQKKDLIQRGVTQVASLWKEEDGSPEMFQSFCIENFQGEEKARKDLFKTLSRNYEQIWGHFNNLSLELNKPLHLDAGPITQADVMFGSFSPGAHLAEDLYKNKIAFLTILNFPFYSLEEKAEMAGEWDRLQWAYARMGDIFTSRVPAAINQEASRIATESDNYVSQYNIIMGNLLNEEGNTLFPDNLHLITHWGLRDELKANYGQEDGLEKQKMIYRVMQRIIDQSIPEKVINNTEVKWNPYSNEVTKEGEPLEAKPEPDTRYQHLLNNFHARKAADPYSPAYPTAIKRAFNQGLELTRQEVEDLFTELVSSPLLVEVGELISRRLGRDLEPFDIWYDGFKARSGISDAELDQIVGARYPDAESFDSDLTNILVKLGWNRERANEISSKVVVEASRGAGHAWGAQMRSQNSHLRTRIGSEGMSYNGYNIAMHEFGHNVEQTISLHDVDYYMLNGVPNTAFTEALAFIFQVRDLKVLGLDADDPQADHLAALDIFWGTYEIMGVSLVDMKVWEWMYNNPDTTPTQLKEKTIELAKEVWNDFFAPVFGVEDAPILGIYSHMISYPLYLSAYPLGHLIEFQIEEHIRNKNLARETDRMFAIGNIIPQHWMKEAVGEPISNQPLLNAVERALAEMK